MFGELKRIYVCLILWNQLLQAIYLRRYNKCKGWPRFIRPFRSDLQNLLCEVGKNKVKFVTGQGGP
jgi:hypothetical protein